MTLRYSVAARTGQANAIITDAGTNPQLKIYTGTQPASTATTASGTLLGTLTFTGALGSAGAAGNVVTLTLGTIASDTNADATGTAQWFRITKSDGSTGVIDGQVTATGGGGELTLNSTSVTAGGTIAISSGTITIGNP